MFLSCCVFVGRDQAGPVPGPGRGVLHLCPDGVQVPGHPGAPAPTPFAVLFVLPAGQPPLPRPGLLLFRVADR